MACLAQHKMPCTPSFLKAICSQLNIDSLDVELLHVTVFACATTCFYSAARLGEFTVSTLSLFNLLMHIKPSDVSSSQIVLGSPPHHSFFSKQSQLSMENQCFGWLRATRPT